jgi:GNAT superfamily N-acetyltransferase
MIRMATLDDIPRMVDLGAQMHAESPEFCGMQFDPGRLANTIAAVIGNTGGGFARVLERDGQVIGGLLAMATPHYFSPDLVACDLAMFIAPEHRGGLAAVRLLAAYRDWGRAIGAVKVQLGVMAGIESWMVEALCERLGARRAGVVMEF